MGTEEKMVIARPPKLYNKGLPERLVIHDESCVLKNVAETPGGQFSYGKYISHLKTEQKLKCFSKFLKKLQVWLAFGKFGHVSDPSVHMGCEKSQQRSTPNKLAAEESPMLVIFQRGASMLKEYAYYVKLFQNAASLILQSAFKTQHNNIMTEFKLVIHTFLNRHYKLGDIFCNLSSTLHKTSGCLVRKSSRGQAVARRLIYLQASHLILQVCSTFSRMDGSPADTMEAVMITMGFMSTFFVNFDPENCSEQVGILNSILAVPKNKGVHISHQWGLVVRVTLQLVQCTYITVPVAIFVISYIFPCKAPFLGSLVFTMTQCRNEFISWKIQIPILLVELVLSFHACFAALGRVTCLLLPGIILLSDKINNLSIENFRNAGVLEHVLNASCRDWMQPTVAVFVPLLYIVSSTALLTIHNEMTIVQVMLCGTVVVGAGLVNVASLSGAVLYMNPDLPGVGSGVAAGSENVTFSYWHYYPPQLERRMRTMLNSVLENCKSDYYHWIYLSVGLGRVRIWGAFLVHRSNQTTPDKVTFTVRDIYDLNSKIPIVVSGQYHKLNPKYKSTATPEDVDTLTKALVDWFVNNTHKQWRKTFHQELWGAVDTSARIAIHCMPYKSPDSKETWFIGKWMVWTWLYDEPIEMRYKDVPLSGDEMAGMRAVHTHLIDIMQAGGKPEQTRPLTSPIWNPDELDSLFNLMEDIAQTGVDLIGAETYLKEIKSVIRANRQGFDGNEWYMTTKFEKNYGLESLKTFRMYMGNDLLGLRRDFSGSDEQVASEVYYRVSRMGMDLQTAVTATCADHDQLLLEYGHLKDGLLLIFGQDDELLEFFEVVDAYLWGQHWVYDGNDRYQFGKGKMVINFK
ncbi:hypothetical protein Fcan01_16402 [Folsomia candida]|uniref:Uncharacterized protein n=1 Tax=Folsomia candida TaxID=158441 RepID=A0A226DVI6_FOLCA|nr:hypothetical protein Fcan01_16402 [Folsomia candida]